MFDSGLGGLTVVKAIIELFETAEIFYIADTKHAPYGEKKAQEILQRCDDITKYLIEKHQIEALVVACNTATSAAIKHLRQKFPTLILVGTEPGIKPAIKVTKSHKIGVLATPATLKGDKYQLLVNELSSIKDIKLYECACIGLVEQIEKGDIESKKTYDMLFKWLEPMKKAGVDTIVLGCTHYPLVEEMIKKIMERNVNIIQTGEAIANRLKTLGLEKEEKSELKISISHTGDINKDMIKMILKKQNINIGKCEI